MATKAFKKLPRRAQRAAFANMARKLKPKSKRYNKFTPARLDDNATWGGYWGKIKSVNWLHKKVEFSRFGTETTRTLSFDEVLSRKIGTRKYGSTKRIKR